MFNVLNLAGLSSSHVDPLLLEMTVETLENDVKKLREENAYLLEEVKSMRVEQHNILHRLEAVEKDSSPNQPMHQFFFACKYF